ncbi:MAG: TIGR04255 family protein [Lentisphaeria bacterium]|nr:TIGR04255 family protein [Lentisphaeria bacterium]
MKHVKSISPDPVVNAVVELRFDSALPKPAIYGILYSALREDYGKQESMPITQLPEELRLKDPNFRFKPWYQLSGNGLMVQIGPDVIAVNCDCSGGYMGWTSFWELIQKILVCVKDTGVVAKITRVGIRYISFFEGMNIFDNLKLAIQRDGKPFVSHATTFMTLIEDAGFTQRLAVKNDAQLKTASGSKTGSTIDIDTFQMEERATFDGIEEAIQDGHRLEKQLFFSLLRDEFLEKLNPVYEEGN